MELIRDYWPLVAIAVAIALLVLFLLLRPRQKIRLTDSAPTRPHMAYDRPPEGRGLAGEAATATSDVTGELIDARVHDKLHEVNQGHDDLLQLKGVGPRFADALHELGFHRFEQLASLSPNEVERLDQNLGAFRGRIGRDRIVEQADYLARGDVDGFEQKFGKL